MKQKKETLVINILGGPGCGKSTTAAALFALLKNQDVDCELITEFAKQLVWEKRKETFKDEIYLFAKQEHRLAMVNGKVDVIITDRPLILTCLYGKDNDSLCDLCYQEFNHYHNVNFVLTREKKFNPNGRNQTLEQAEAIDKQIVELLNDYDIPYITVKGDANAAEAIMNILRKKK